MIKVKIRNIGSTTVTLADIKARSSFTISDWTSTSTGTETTFSDDDPDADQLSQDSKLVIATKELGIFWFDLPTGRDWMVSSLYTITATTDRAFSVTETTTSPSKHAISFFISIDDSTLVNNQTATVTVTSLNGYATTTATETFTPATISLGSLSTLTITSSEVTSTTTTWTATASLTVGNLAAGTYTGVVTATSGSLSRSTGTITVTIT